jgi:hypothetical protein
MFHICSPETVLEEEEWIRIFQKFATLLKMGD